MSPGETPSSATTRQRDEYISRINRVIDYIDSNIDRELSLEELAGVACFSPFHFHRIFSAMVGETLYQFIQRIRIEKAAVQLIQNPKKPVTQIAFDCGFSGPDTFARAFKLAYGVSASEWRRDRYQQYLNMENPFRKDCKTVRNSSKDLGSLSRYSKDAAGGTAKAVNQIVIRRKPMAEVKPVAIKVEELQPFHVAYVRHIGPYKSDEKLFQGLWDKLMKWASARDLLRFPETKTLIIYHDAPKITDQSKLRISVCISVPEDTPVSGEIGKMAVQGGKYAMIRFELRSDEYQGAWDYVFYNWLPDSGYQPDDRPCFELYHSSGDGDSEKKFLVDICVPVKPL